MNRQLIKFHSRVVKALEGGERGVTAIEYGLIAVLIAVALIAGATVLGTNLNSLFSNLGAKITTTF